MRCECAADGLQQRGGRMRMRCLQIANAWRTDANAWRTDANAWQTDCNNATLKNQKPYFCNSKTPFLHDKNHTFARQKPYFCMANM